ncbi:hypothetical protein [Brevibacillus centrosporus]|uniref:Lipoprotein n=1 Tax=Brevibacillus centrosporus TaxID=54910 RepID=A0A1I3Z3Q8_9BACL|nr:hypothetical protein [Brevibacillus centrosporus]SFK38695.1 hypothetical protein SAMN05518846_112156 [Brevibacillus centrosporus]
MKLPTSCLVFLFLLGCETVDRFNSMNVNSAIDRDKLVDQYSMIHDFNSGEEFEIEKLIELQDESDRKDYKKVLGNFFAQYLQKEIESFQTINKSGHDRHILVITKDRWLYRVDIKQWLDYGNIWTVDMYGGFLLTQ